MSATDPSPHRSQPVRLRDVPFDVRMRAARTEARKAKTVKEAESLLAAAIAPSDRVYYIKPDDSVQELRKAA